MNPNDFPAPSEGLVLTHFVVVSDPRVSAEFYAKLLDGTVVMDAGPTIVKAANAWIIMNPGGGPTPDKPDVILDVPKPGATVSAFLNVRVADMAATQQRLRTRGIEFLTEPMDRGAEIRAYVRDPDGHLIEFGQATGVLG